MEAVGEIDGGDGFGFCSWRDMGLSALMMPMAFPKKTANHDVISAAAFFPPPSPPPPLPEEEEGSGGGGISWVPRSLLLCLDRRLAGACVFYSGRPFLASRGCTFHCRYNLSLCVSVSTLSFPAQASASRSLRFSLRARVLFLDERQEKLHTST